MIFTPWEKEHAMKKSSFTEEQIAFAIKQSGLGTRVEEICRKMGISDATFYVAISAYSKKVNGQFWK